MSGPRTVLMVLALATLVVAGEEVASRDGEEAQATGRNIRVTKFYQVPSKVFLYLNEGLSKIITKVNSQDVCCSVIGEPEL